MISTFFSYKRVIIALAVVLVFVVSVVVSMYMSSSPDVIITDSEISKPMLSTQVNYGEYDKYYTDTEKSSILSKIATAIKISTNKQSGSYEAVARNGTYTETLFEQTVPIRELLFDIRAIPVSYIIRFDGSEQGEYDILSIRCAPQDQQIDPTKTCKDLTDE